MALYESNTFAWAGQVRNVYGIQWFAQTFTPDANHDITHVILSLGRPSGDTPGTITVSIRATAGGLPTGGDLASGTTNGNTVPEVGFPTPAPEERQITFGASYTLSASTTYAIVVRAPSGDGSNRLHWNNNVSAPYPDGQVCLSTDAGSIWFGDATDDLWFEEYGDAAGAVYAEGTKTVTAAASVVSGPGKATTPTPTDDQENILIVGKDELKQLTWVAPAGETPDYLVYFKQPGGSWELQETITDDSLSYTLSDALLAALNYYSVYEWRIDTRDSDTGWITEGDTWTFISQSSAVFTDYTRRSDYDADKVWQPGTGWVDINSFNFAGGGQYKEQVVVVGHKVIYFGDV